MSSAIPFLLSERFLRSPLHMENTTCTIIYIVSSLRADLIDLRPILSCERLMSRLNDEAVTVEIMPDGGISFCSGGDEHEDYAEDDEERVGDGVGDGVAQGGHAAAQALLHGSETGGGLAGTGTASQSDGGMEFE